MSTTSSEFESQMSRLRDRFVTMHHQRHDRLEILLEQMREPEQARTALDEVEAILHKIAGAAGTLGMIDLGLCARQVEELVRDHIATGHPNTEMLFEAIDAFLDVSLEVCNPTEHLQAAS